MTIKNGLEDYYLDIYNSLMKMEVTNEKNILIGAENGLDFWINMSETIKKKEGCIFFCGNGASATMAEHMSHDCFQNMKINTYTCSETSHLTAISNDLSFEDVFSYRINRIGNKNDMLVAISSSGNSPNIVKAIIAAKTKEMFVVTVSGKKEDNLIRKMGDLNFYIPLSTYGMVESAHAVLLHSWLDLYMDRYIEGGRH